MGNAESTVGAAKASMQVNKVMGNITKEFEDLTGTREKQLSPEEEAKKQEEKRQKGWLAQQQRQRERNAEYSQKQKERQERKSKLSDKWQQGQKKNASTAPAGSGGWFKRDGA